MRIGTAALLFAALVTAAAIPLPAAMSAAGAADRVAARTFIPSEKETIVDYYSRRDGGGQGRHGPDRLPPGLQKQLDRSGLLPPGLEKKRLPEDLRERLPPRVASTARVIVGADVLLVDVTSQVILDIVRGVVRD